MKYVLIFCIVATTYLITSHQMDLRYEQGLADGRKTALNLYPPSAALEDACLSLWVGDQAKKYGDKQ